MQPDLEQLDLNMEDNEGVEEAKEELKLGKLQFSLDYDFQKGEVRCRSLLYTAQSIQQKIMGKRSNSE